MRTREITIREAFKLKSGKFLSAKNIIEGKYPVYGGNGINGFHHEYTFEEEKIIIGRVGAHCGNIHISEPFSWITDNALFIHKKHYDYDDKYLLYLLRKLKLNQYSSQSGQPLISEGRLKDVKIPLPPFEDQKKIAAILDAADALRQKDKALIAKYEELTQSLFLDMFGDPMTNPNGWPIKILGDLIINIKGGFSVGGEERKLKDGEIGVLKISAVTSGIFKASEYKAVDSSVITKELVKPSKGDLLFSRANTRELVGAVAIVDKDYDNLFLPDKLWSLVLKTETLNNWFLKFLLFHDGFRNNLRDLATGSSGSMLNISKAKLVTLCLPLPPINLQNQFAERVQQIEKQKQLAQQNLQKSEELFNSLLQRAFKGELTNEGKK